MLQTESNNSQIASRKLPGSILRKSSFRAERVDLELPLPLVGPELVEALKELEPHGMGNPAPIFAMRGAKFKSARTFGKNKTT